MKLCSSPLEALDSCDDAPLSKEEVGVRCPTLSTHCQDVAALQGNWGLHCSLIASLSDGFWTAQHQFKILSVPSHSYNLECCTNPRPKSGKKMSRRLKTKKRSSPPSSSKAGIPLPTHDSISLEKYDVDMKEIRTRCSIVQKAGRFNHNKEEARTLKRSGPTAHRCPKHSQ